MTGTPGVGQLLTWALRRLHEAFAEVLLPPIRQLPTREDTLGGLTASERAGLLEVLLEVLLVGRAPVRGGCGDKGRIGQVRVGLSPG